MDYFTCSTNCDLIHISSCSSGLYPSVLDSSTGENGCGLQRNTYVEQSKHGQHFTPVEQPLMDSHIAIVLCCSGPELLRFRVQQHRVKSYISTKLGHQATSIEYISSISCEAVQNPPRPNPPLSESFLSEITFPESHPVWGMFSLLLLR